MQGLNRTQVNLPGGFESRSATHFGIRRRRQIPPSFALETATNMRSSLTSVDKPYSMTGNLSLQHLAKCAE
jgi:hypothetical protein